MFATASEADLVAFSSFPKCTIQTGIYVTKVYEEKVHLETRTQAAQVPFNNTSLTLYMYLKTLTQLVGCNLGQIEVRSVWQTSKLCSLVHKLLDLRKTDCLTYPQMYFL